MTTQWLPIEPTLTKDGTFAVFSNWPNPRQFKASTSEDGEYKLGLGEITEDSLSASTLTTLGVANRLSTSAEVNVRTIVRDVFAYEEIQSATPGLTIKATRWGAGFRIFLSVVTTNSSVELTTSSVAAASELGTTNVSIHIRAHGIAYPEALSWFPAMRRFDTESWEAIQGAEQQLRTWLGQNKEDRTKIRPVPFSVLMSDVPKRPGIREARARLFGVRMVAGWATLHEARAKARRAGLDEKLVEEGFRWFADYPNQHTRPHNGALKRAKDWLAEATIARNE